MRQYFEREREQMKTNKYIFACASAILVSGFIPKNVYAANMCSQIFATSEMSAAVGTKDLVKKAAAREADLKKAVQSYVAKIQMDRRIWSEKDASTIEKIETLMKSKDFDLRVEYAQGKPSATGRSVEELSSLLHSLEGLKNMKGLDETSVILYVASYKTIGANLSHPQTFTGPGHILTFLRAEYGLQYFGANGINKDPSSAEFLTARLNMLNQDLYALSSLNSNAKEIAKGTVTDPQKITQTESQLNSMIKTVDTRFEVVQDNLSKKVTDSQKSLKSRVYSYLKKIKSDRRVWSEKDAETLSQIEALMKAKDFDAHLESSGGRVVAVGRSVNEVTLLVNSLEGLKNMKGLDAEMTVLYLVGYKTVGGLLSRPQTFVSPEHVLTYLRAEYGLQYFGANGLSKDQSSAEFLTARLNVLNQDLYTIKSLKTQFDQSTKSNKERAVQVETQLADMVNHVNEQITIFKD